MNFKKPALFLGAIIIASFSILIYETINYDKLRDEKSSLNLQLQDFYSSYLKAPINEINTNKDDDPIDHTTPSDDLNPLRLITISNENNRYLTTPPISSQSYNEAIDSIRSSKNRHLQSFTLAASSNQKNKVIMDSKTNFIRSVTSLLPYWYGTPWDYNGTSDTPQQGSIACGYFITTVLEDAGLNIERNALAQQASENIIKSLVTEDYVKRYSNISLDDFIESINKWGEGLYIVGLDFHVGFIWHDGNNINFIHSTILAPKGVISEPAETSKILNNSKYRVLGKISDDDALIIKWLNSEKINTQI